MHDHTSRRGRRSSLQDEENGSNKESPPVMQPLGANQIDLQLPDSNKDASAEAGVAKSGLIRCATSANGHAAPCVNPYGHR